MQTYSYSNESGPIAAPILRPLAPAPPILGTTYSNGSSETATTYWTHYKTSYTAAYNSYKQYYFANKVEPGDVNGNTSTTTGTALWLVALPYLPPTNATPAIADSAAPGPGNAIANNPAVNVTTNNLGGAVTTSDYNTTSSAANLMPASFGSSFSYDFVAGAYFPANGAGRRIPNAVVAATTAVDVNNNTIDSVTIDGHTSYANPIVNSSITPTINVPTLVRTGTGSITVVAAGDVEFLDTTAPGAIYTAGAATATPSDFSAPVMSIQYIAKQNGLVSTPSWGAAAAA